MERQEIINITKLKCDELSIYDDGEVIKTALLENIIDEETNRLLMFLPPHLVPVSTFYDENASTSAPSDTKTTNSDGTGYIILPDRFLRLINFKLEEWEKPVVKPILETDPLYLAQKQVVSRGGPGNPVCALRKTTEGKILEYYSVRTSHVVETALYVPTTLPENLDDFLVDPLTWYLCAKSFQIIGQKEKGDMALAKLKEFIDLHSY